MTETGPVAEFSKLPPNHAPKAIRGARCIALIIEHEKDSFRYEPFRFIEELDAIQKKAQNLKEELLVTKEWSKGIAKAQALTDRLDAIITQWAGDDRGRRQLKDFTVDRLKRFLRTNDPIEIKIGDTLLSQNEVIGLLEGDSGFGGTIRFERSREELIQHITEDQQLAKDYNYSCRQMGEVLESIMATGHTYANTAIGKITINNRTYYITNTITASPGGLSFNYLEDEIPASWTRWFVGDFTVVDESGKRFIFAGSCAKACKNRSYIEPKYADGAEEYRIDIGEFLEFFHIIPEGKTTQNIRSTRLREYANDLKNTDTPVRFYGAMKLLDMNDVDALSWVKELFNNPTTKSMDENVMVMRVMRRIAEAATPELNSQILNYFKNLNLEGIIAQNRDEFEQLRQDTIKQLKGSN